jgi:omega-6 fatty acid desaturase (delta-12 desaturase)
VGNVLSDKVFNSLQLNKYRTPNDGRGAFELATTAVPFAAIWFLMYWGLLHGHVWLYLLMSLPAAGFLVRLFLIQHDCGHHAFFANKTANDWVGRVISILTLTPYDHWRRCHATHHATHGNLGRRGVGDVDTLTVGEYLARSRWARLRYRAYRHPLVLFGIGPAFVFVLQNRFPAGFMRKGWRPWASTMGTNAAIAAVAALLTWLVGFSSFIVIQAPVLLLGAACGVWLFYVQHQFELSYWERPETWNFRDSALRGSSHYELPAILRWFTANIGMHHVHHLSSQIPYYRLPAVLRDHRQLREVNRLTLGASLKCAHLALWDEKQQRLVSFKDLRKAHVAKDRDTAPCSIHSAADPRTETVRAMASKRGSFDGAGLPHYTYRRAKKC